VNHVAYEQWSSETDFAAGSFDGTTLAGEAVVMGTPVDTFDYVDPYGDGSSTTYEVAVWTSPEERSGFGVTELVPSWNAETPPGSWLQVSVSGVADDGTRSKEYVLGRWAAETSSIHRTSVAAQGDELATVAADTLITRPGRSLSSWRLTLTLFREQGALESPVVRLLGVMTSRLANPAVTGSVSPAGGAAGMVLDVPTYSQELHLGEYPEYNGGGEAWCSPTSTAMVMDYWAEVTGRDRHRPKPEEYGWVDPSLDDPWVVLAAARTYDWSYEGTGNWPFNTAYAASYGLEAFVTRLRSLTEAEQFIKAGIPLVVSVSFQES
jgi:hypothetical protein